MSAAMTRFGYARVGTRNQDARGQRCALEVAGCERIWTEYGSSPSSRAQFDALLVHAGPEDTVVVTALDRLGRSLANVVSTVSQLGQRGIGVWALAEQVDTTPPSGRPILSLFGALAECERELVSERTQAGLQAARARGRAGGRPTVMTEERRAAALQMLSEGYPITSISSTLGVSRATVYRHLYGPG